MKQSCKIAPPHITNDRRYIHWLFSVQSFFSLLTFLLGRIECCTCIVSTLKINLVLEVLCVFSEQLEYGSYISVADMNGIDPYFKTAFRIFTLLIYSYFTTELRLNPHSIFACSLINNQRDSVRRLFLSSVFSLVFNFGRHCKYLPPLSQFVMLFIRVLMYFCAFSFTSQKVIIIRCSNVKVSCTVSNKNLSVS